MTPIYFTADQLIWLARAWDNTASEVKGQIDANCKFEQQIQDTGALDMLDAQQETAE